MRHLHALKTALYTFALCLVVALGLLTFAVGVAALNSLVGTWFGIILSLTLIVLTKKEF